MKELIQNYLQSQGIIEDYKVLIMRFSTNLYKNDAGEYVLEFPQWFFACPKPIFTSEQIEHGIKSELIESKTDLLTNSHTGEELEVKLEELNALQTIEEVQAYE